MSKLLLSCQRRGGGRRGGRREEGGGKEEEEGEGRKDRKKTRGRERGGRREVKQEGCSSTMTETHIIEFVDGFLDSCDVIGQGNHPVFDIINQFDGLQRYPVP